MPASRPEPTPTPIELLAPAGDRACLEAALQGGADAIYLGLTTLNARRYARNFSEAGLAEACALVHEQGKRVYLTLNTDLAQDELARAAYVLELSSKLKIDAVIVRDPALLALARHFPELAYHLSTQACIANSADVEAARGLGASRVVLAREMALAEIATASQVPGIETEVFVHGALCFAVSGRCLLSSWVGGRSGNRGQCTSPCRVPWNADGKPCGNPFSPHDLSLVARINELRSAGVAALKIEGRMKNPSWVRSSVALLRKAMDGSATPEELAREAERRGATPGRRVTAAFLDGRRDEIIEPSTALQANGGAEDARSIRGVAVREPVATLLREVDAPRRLGQMVEPDRLRLTADQAPQVLTELRPRDGAILEGLDAERLRHLVADHPTQRLIAALPPVFFEEERTQIERLASASASLGLAVEVNSWGGWLLAKRAGARMIAGPGLGILNALAARELRDLGCEEATASVEADMPKLDALFDRTPLPCSVVVFARPALMLTRIEIPAAIAQCELEDRGDVRLRAMRRGTLWELRSVQPFDLRNRRLPPTIAHAVVDLVSSPDPIAEWQACSEAASHFNFDRALG
jgi:collagenase-like PrtC family protease